MNGTRLLMHAPGAPGLRLLGLGPGLRPTRGLYKLQRLLNQHAFWAQGRSISQLRRMLAGSAALKLRCGRNVMPLACLLFLRVRLHT